MKSRQAGFWILFFLLLAAAAFSMNHLLRSGMKEPKVDLGAIIPLRIGAWRGQDLPLQPGTLRLLGTENVLLRSYAPPDQNDTPVLFCLTFSAGNHRVAHPPEVCYEGQGWTVDRNKESILEFPGGGHAAMKVQHLSISRGGRTQEVIIWFRNGSSDTSSFFQQKVEMLLSSLFGHHPWTAMIRLSAVTESGEAQQALESIASFGAALLPYLDALSQKMETP